MRNAGNRSGIERSPRTRLGLLQPGRAHGINRWRARCIERMHAGFGGRLCGKGPHHSDVGPRRAAHPTRSHARPGRTGRPSTGRRGTDDRMPQPEGMRNAECRDGAGCPPRTWQEKPAGMDGLHGQETAQDPSGLPALPRRRPRQPCHHRGIDHRRATYSETGPCGSEEGRAEKGSQQGIPRRAAYPIPSWLASIGWPALTAKALPVSTLSV